MTRPQGEHHSRIGVRTGLTLLVAAGLAVGVAAGCGSSGGDSSADDAIAEVDPRFAALPENGQRLIEGAVNPDEARHVEAAMGLQMEANGNSMGAGADPTQPMMVIDVDSAGETHTVIDMSKTFGTVTGQNTGMPEMKAEQWTDGEWLYMEYTGFDQLFEAQAGAAAGVPWAGLTAPGVFKVDLNRVQESGLASDTVLSQSTGQNVDVSAYLYAVAEQVGDAQPDPDDPSKMRIETTAAELTRQNADLAESLPMLSGLPGMEGASDSTGLMDALGHLPIVYLFSTDDQDRIDDLTIEMDMTPFLAHMAESQGSADASTFEGVTMNFTTLFTFDYDTDIDVTMPTDVDDDRTDEFITALEQTAALVDEVTDTSPETTNP